MFPVAAAIDDVELEVVISNKVVVPSPGELRGLPVVGHGGAIRGSDPLGELLRREA